MESAPDATLEEEEALKEALGKWNMAVTGHRDYRPVNFFLKDESGAIRGGVLAYVWGRWLHVDTVWIEEEFRGQDWGTRMLEAAHEAGREKGAEAAFLDTFSWQARPFYERMGYEVVASVAMPAGFERHYMMKAPV
jgi:GNAT superfamily N-acetyltransferase